MAGLIPADIPNSSGKLNEWTNPNSLKVSDIVTLEPVQAKALYVVGVMMRNFEAAGHLLRFGDGKLYPNYYLQAYLTAATAIEMLGRCKLEFGTEQSSFKTNKGRPKDKTHIEKGFEIILSYGNNHNGIVTNHRTYPLETLEGLRNFAAHGQAEAKVAGQHVAPLMDIEFLDSFARRLMQAFDGYYLDLLNKRDERLLLAESDIQLLYTKETFRCFRPPIDYAYEVIVEGNQPPSQGLVNTDWQIYKG